MPNRTQLVAIIFLLLCSTIGSADDAPPSPERVRAACDLFCSEPLGEHARLCAAVIWKFSEESDLVKVTVGPHYLPWMKRDDIPKHTDLLVVAFIAGNVASQLDSGVKASDPYSGIIQVFRVYRALNAKDSSYEIAEIEHLLALHREGKLSEHFESLAKKVKKSREAQKEARDGDDDNGDR
jgi:hypothetical protein